MTNRVLQLTAWIILIAIASATLSPLAMRPRLPMDVDLERALAFLTLGVLFAMAYPRQLWFAVAVVLIGAFGLELLQVLRPDRHGRLHDAVVKAAAACVGLGIGWLSAQLMRKRS